MIWFFWPTSRKGLFTFQAFCPRGSPGCPDCSSFCPLRDQARKRGVLGWGWGCFACVHIPERGVWLLSKEQGLGVVFWAKWEPIRAKWDPSEKFVRKMGHRIGGKKYQLFNRSKPFQSPLAMSVKKQSLVGKQWAIPSCARRLTNMRLIQGLMEVQLHIIQSFIQ